MYLYTIRSTPSSRLNRTEPSRVQESRWNFVTFLGRPTNFGQPGIAGRRIRLDETAGVESRAGKFEISARHSVVQTILSTYTRERCDRSDAQGDHLTS